MNNSFDFMNAKNKHLQWKIKLRSFLDGKESMTIEQATSHKECDLGKWLYSDGFHTYKHLPEMVTLEKIHADMHNSIKEVFNAKQKGNITQAEAELVKVNNISSEIVKLLDKLSKV